MSTAIMHRLASSVITDIKTPSAFFSFLCRTFTWVDLVRESETLTAVQSRDVNNILISLMEEVAKPWLTSNKKPTDVVASGLLIVLENTDPADFLLTSRILVDGMGKELARGSWSEEAVDSWTAGIRALLNISHAFSDPKLLSNVTA